VLLSLLKTQCAAGVSCDWMIVEYTHDEYCNMFVSLGTFNSCGVPAQEYVLRYPSQHHQDANVFWRLEQHICGASVTRMRHMNAGHPWTVDSSHWRCRDYSCVEWQPQRCSYSYHTTTETILTWSSQYFTTMSCAHGVHICFQTVVLYGCNSANGCDINTL
jgi:hypothetical protein